MRHVVQLLAELGRLPLRVGGLCMSSCLVGDAGCAATGLALATSYKQVYGSFPCEITAAEPHSVSAFITRWRHIARQQNHMTQSTLSIAGTQTDRIRHASTTDLHIYNLDTVPPTDVV